jgi:hypothetical protein
MFLVDTNVWLESLLQHQNAPEVKAFLDHTPSHLLSITDFTFHSLGIILTRLKKQTFSCGLFKTCLWTARSCWYASGPNICRD